MQDSSVERRADVVVRSEHGFVSLEHARCGVIELLDLNEEVKLLVRCGKVGIGGMEVLVAEQPESMTMKEQVECDAFEGTLGLVLSVGKVAGNKIALLQFDPISRQQTVQERISSKSELGFQENRVFVGEVVKWDAIGVAQGSKKVKKNTLKGRIQMPGGEEGEEGAVERFPHAESILMGATEKVGAVFSSVATVGGASCGGTESKLELLSLEWE